MNIRALFFAIVCSGLTAFSPASAQTPSATQPGDIESLKKQMLEMQAALKQMQIQHQREVSALKAEVENLHRIIADVPKTVVTGSDAVFPTTDESVAAPTGPPGAPTAAAAPGATTPAWLSGPITIAGGGKTFLNVSFIAQFAAAASRVRCG